MVLDVNHVELRDMNRISRMLVFRGFFSPPKEIGTFYLPINTNFCFVLTAFKYVNKNASFLKITSVRL